MTLSDPELQTLRDAALTVIRAVGVSTGGANVQFALDRATGEMVVIEMNPRVSRSSALASKATGFPIAKIAARLAVGYTLDELPNEITGVTPASFEPTLDYVAVKMPRFAFEKLPGASTELTTHMKSVGEVLALGPHLRRRRSARRWPGASSTRAPRRRPTSPRPSSGCAPPRRTATTCCCGRSAPAPASARLREATGIDPWFLAELADAGRAPAAALRGPLDGLDARPPARRPPRRAGRPRHRRGHRRGRGRPWAGAGGRSACARPTTRWTPAPPSSRRSRPTTTRPSRPRASCRATTGRRSSCSGSGPNRIGQGIEFDYCCVHAAETARELGYASVMVNCNPETVSTDHGVSDRLYLEPVTIDAVLDICEAEQPVGVIAQLGGQTPLRLARALADEGVPVLGTPPEAIDLAEDRGRFGAPARRARPRGPALGARRRPGGGAARRGRGRLPGAGATRATCSAGGPWRSATRPRRCARYLARERPEGVLLVDRFLENATELDVDALSRRARLLERRGDGARRGGRASTRATRPACCRPRARGRGWSPSSRSRPPPSPAALGAVGLLNVQFAVRDGRVLRHRGQPARVAHGALRRQGHRGPPGAPRRAADARRRARRPRTCPSRRRRGRSR